MLVPPVGGGVCPVVSRGVCPLVRPQVEAS